MSERTIDDTRAGGNAGPKHAEAAPEMTYEQAVEPEDTGFDLLADCEGGCGV